MARIRTIKPEFFRHEALFEAEQADNLPLRLAFIGLWTAADKEGRFKWQPRALKLDCLPYDSCDFSRVLDALVTRGFIQKYEYEGQFYGVIPSWKSHQVINNRETESILPNPHESTILTREARVDDASGTRLEHAQGEGKGREGEGEGKGNTCDDAKASPRPIPAESKRAAKPKSQKPEPEEKPGRTAFAAYALAYVERYGSEPPQNAKTNSLFVQLVQRIGATEAPRVAGWYVKNENLPFYVQRSHPVDALVRDCEGMLTRMRRGTPAIAQRGTFRPVGVELEQRNKDAVSEFLASSAKDITPEVGHG